MCELFDHCNDQSGALLHTVVSYSVPVMSQVNVHVCSSICGIFA